MSCAFVPHSQTIQEYRNDGRDTLNINVDMHNDLKVLEEWPISNKKEDLKEMPKKR